LRKPKEKKIRQSIAKKKRLAPPPAVPRRRKKRAKDSKVILKNMGSDSAEPSPHRTANSQRSKKEARDSKATLGAMDSDSSERISVSAPRHNSKRQFHPRSPEEKLPRRRKQPQSPEEILPRRATGKTKQKRTPVEAANRAFSLEAKQLWSNLIAAVAGTAKRKKIASRVETRAKTALVPRFTSDGK
jgi:hypothetical protein